MLREIHHRVKNNLQVISSLLNLEARRFMGPVMPEVDEVKSALADCQGRVRSIALVHEKLYQTSDVSQVEFGNYLGALVQMIMSTSSCSSRVRMQLDIENVRLGVDQAIPCGLLVHELVTNALKHAFPGERPGRVLVEFGRDRSGSLRLVIRDDGVGMPPHLTLQNSDTLGLELVSTLARQLHAELTIECGEGTCFRLSFPDGG